MSTLHEVPTQLSPISLWCRLSSCGHFSSIDSLPKSGSMNYLFSFSKFFIPLRPEVLSGSRAELDQQWGEGGKDMEQGMCQTILQECFGARSDGLIIKSIDCSSRGSGFDSQQLCGRSPKSVIEVWGKQLLWTLRHMGRHTSRKTLKHIRSTMIVHECHNLGLNEPRWFPTALQAHQHIESGLIYF